MRTAIESGQLDFENRPESSDPQRQQFQFVMKALRDHGLKLGLNDSVFAYTQEVDSKEGEGEGSVDGPVDQSVGQDAYSEFVNSVKKLKL